MIREGTRRDTRDVSGSGTRDEASDGSRDEIESRSRDISKDEDKWDK